MLQLMFPPDPTPFVVETGLYRLFVISSHFLFQYILVAFGVSPKAFLTEAVAAPAERGEQEGKAFLPIPVPHLLRGFMGSQALLQPSCMLWISSLPDP